MSHLFLAQKIKADWLEVLGQYLNTEEFQKLSDKVYNLYSSQICYPPQELLFNALNLTSF